MTDKKLNELKTALTAVRYRGKKVGFNLHVTKNHVTIETGSGTPALLTKKLFTLFERLGLQYGVGSNTDVSMCGYTHNKPSERINGGIMQNHW